MSMMSFAYRVLSLKFSISLFTLLGLFSFSVIFCMFLDLPSMFGIAIRFGPFEGSREWGGEH